MDVEVVLGSSVPLDEAEAAHELERLQRRSDERLLAGACKEERNVLSIRRCFGALCNVADVKHDICPATVKAFGVAHHMMLS